MYLWRAMPSQLFRTGRPEALAPGNSCVLSLTHPAPPVQTALSRASPCCVLLRHAAQAGQRRAVAAAGEKAKLLIRTSYLRFAHFQGGLAATVPSFV